MGKEMEMRKMVLGTTNKDHVGRMSGSLARRAVRCLMVRWKIKKTRRSRLPTS
jgi:hypothetical protein